MKKTALSILLLIIVFTFSSCTKSLKPSDDDPISSILDLNIPKSFEFKTANEVTVNISSFKSTQSNKVKYDIYLYNPLGEMQSYTSIGDGGQSVTETIQLNDALSNLTASYITEASSFEVKLTVPTFYNSLYIIKNDMGVYSSVIIPVTSNKLSATFKDETNSFKSVKSPKGTVDMIFGVNGSSEVFQINTETGEYTPITTIPLVNGGSSTCAIDPIKRILYTVGLTKPYYLLAYDIDADSWTTIAGTGYSAPRLAYNISDGLLYFSFDEYILLIDPSNAKMLTYYTVKDLHEKAGGDIAFSTDGSMYLSTTSGIYELSYKNRNQYNSTRISNTLTNYPTSLAFGTDDTFWWASNVNNKGQVFTFNLNNSSETSRFSPYDHNIDDIAMLAVDVVVEADADNDGAIDLYDEYPNDPTRATNSYVPSISGLGSYAFEDLWPYQGDYDFNDLIVNYRYTNVLNAGGLVVETKMYFKIKNVGGSFRNGFGIELDMNKDLIQQVTGYNHTEGIISLNGQGIENNQAKPVIIVFDNAHNNIDVNDGELELLVTYTQPIQPAVIGEFNPFIFINGERGREVHLADFSPTRLATMSLLTTGNDDSDVATGRYYKNTTNLPWAINVIQDFEYPKEKSPIILGYLKFASWAESGGSVFQDWYINKPEYRNNTYIEID